MRENWHGYEMERFQFEDREAMIVFPKGRRCGNPWALKTEYWDAFPDVELRLLEQGFHIAFARNKNRWFTREECAAKARFAKYISDTYGLNTKCVPIGMSCGGGYAVKFAGLYPELVACLFIDAPVLNFCSIPGKPGNPVYESMWNNEFVNAYPGVQRWQLPGSNEHPICQTDSIIAHKIPTLLVYGLEDQTVIYEENGKLLEEAMADTGLLKVIPVGARGHHPHGLIGDNQVIVDFILEHC